MKNTFISGTRLPNNIRKIENFQENKKYSGFFNELNIKLDLNDKKLNEILNRQNINNK